MALTGTPGTELHQVIVTLNKGHHTQQNCVLLPLRQAAGLNPRGPQQQLLPLLRRKFFPGGRQRIQNIPLGELDLPQGFYTEGTTITFLGNGSIVIERYFGVETTGDRKSVV